MSNKESMLVKYILDSIREHLCMTFLQDDKSHYRRILIVTWLHANPKNQSIYIGLSLLYIDHYYLLCVHNRAILTSI